MPSAHDILFTFLLLFANSICNAHESIRPRLLQVHVLYRHGDRSPMHSFPNDPYASNWTETGWGQLTQRGVRQHLDLGRYLRQRYTEMGLLTDGIPQHHVYIRSTDTKRSIMSAQAQLAGLFPPVATRALGPQLYWRPVPVHVVPKPHDQLLKMSSPCPRFYRLWAEFQAGPLYRSVERNHSSLFRHLEKLMGVKHVDLWRAIKLADPLAVWADNGFILPKWLTPSLQKQMAALQNKKHEWMFKSLAMQRLRGGPVVDAMLINMERMAENYSSRNFSLRNVPRFVGFSAHDSTVAATLQALKVFHPAVKPPLASVLMVELFARPPVDARSHDVNFTVRFYYRPTPYESPKALHVPGCFLECSLGELRSLIRDIVPINLTEECFDDGYVNEFSVQTRQSVYISLIVIVVVEFFVIAFCAHRMRRPTTQTSFGSVQYRKLASTVN